MRRSHVHVVPSDACGPMVVTKDGLVHLVEARQTADYKGVLWCGLLFRKESKYRTKWTPLGVPVKQEVVAVRSSKRPTCMWCVARIKR